MTAIDLSRLVPVASLPVEGVDWFTPRLARTLIYERRIPSYKVGRKVLVNLDDVAAYAAANLREAQR